MIEDFYSRAFPPVHVNGDYVLREQEIRDTEPFYNYYSDEEVAKYILASKPLNLAEACAEIHYCRNLFYYKRGIYWTLARKEDDIMIGAVGIYLNNQHHRGEICYDLDRAFWKKGIMTKAMKTIMAFAFNEMQLERLEAVTIKANTASIAILNKLNFFHEGSLRMYRYFNNKSHDVEMYALTRNDFLKQPK